MVKWKLNHQELDFKKQAMLEVLNHNFISHLQTIIIKRINGIERADKCHNYLTFLNENHHQKYIKVNKQEILMDKYHSKEELPTY